MLSELKAVWGGGGKVVLSELNAVRGGGGVGGVKGCVV